MSSKTILGIAGAAMIGTLAGTGAAHAVLTAGASGTDGVPIFAKETFQRDRPIVPTDGSGGTYYEAASGTSVSGEFDVQVPFGIAVPETEDAVVTIELRDLVLAGFTPTLEFTTGGTSPTAVSFSATSDVSIVSGGQKGDRRVQFNLDLDSTSGAFAITHQMTVKLGNLGIRTDANGIEDGVGTIIIKSERPGVSPVVSVTVTLNKVVRVRPALVTTVRGSEQTADAQEGFMKFRPGSGVGLDQLAASMGDLQIGVATSTEGYHNTTATRYYRNARRGQSAVEAPSNILKSMDITFTGDTTFVDEDSTGKKRVYLGDRDCAPERSSIEDADGDLTAALSDVSGSDPAYLCLKVDGLTDIPETEAYKAAIDYTVLDATDPVHPPQDITLNLGSINRDGTTVQIPYLTSNRKYNQRVIVVNRAGRPVSYNMTFRPTGSTTDDPATTFTALSEASGMLREGRTVWLVHRDLVTFAVAGRDTGGHGSAEMTIASGLVDVSTVLTNREDGSTDTVVLDPQ